MARSNVGKLRTRLRKQMVVYLAIKDSMDIVRLQKAYTAARATSDLLADVLGKLPDEVWRWAVKLAEKERSGQSTIRW